MLFEPDPLELLAEVKAEAAAINNEGREAQIAYLKEVGFWEEEEAPVQES